MNLWPWVIWPTETDPLWLEAFTALPSWGKQGSVETHGLRASLCHLNWALEGGPFSSPEVLPAGTAYVNHLDDIISTGNQVLL